jgi:hypothetical protein
VTRTRSGPLASAASIVLLLVASGAGITACASGARAPATMATANPVEATPTTGPRPGSGQVALGGAGSTVAGPMKPIAPSAMLAELTAIGLDPAALPPLAQLEPDKLRRVMRTFTRSLGAVCADCHVENDFAAPTPRKNVAAKMWDQYVRGLSLAAPRGAPDSLTSPLYCDSCHAGRITPLLDRRDGKELAEWMDANFVERLKRTDGKEHRCETCHGEPFASRFLAAWTKDAPRVRPHAR